MATLSTALKTWGSGGSEYPDNYSYVEGEQPVDAWDNYLTSNIISDIQTLIDRINAIDSDGDAIVDKADDIDAAITKTWTGSHTFSNTTTFQNLVDLEPIAEPAAPATDDVRVFVDSVDNNLKAKDPAGDVVTIVTT